MRTNWDVIVIGCGPGGAATSVFAAEAGLDVVVLEKDSFPRFHIGESLTGTAGEILRGLGVGEQLDRLQFPVKSGVKVMGKTGNEYFVPVLAPTWQVRRSDFDDVLMKRAEKAGVEVRRGRVVGVLHEGERVSGVVYVSPEGERIELHAGAVIDASGTACVMSHLGVAGPRAFDDFGDQIAVFSQLEDCERDPGEMGDNTFIYHAETHHWAWFIPLSPSVVSIGVVIPKATFKRLGKRPEEAFDWGLEHISPDLARRTAGRGRVEPVRAVTDYSYRAEPFAGPGWFCIGDSHRFADPIFSFGVTAAMQEGRAAVDALLSVRAGASWQDATATYTDYSNIGQDAIHDFIAYFWKYPGFFGAQMRGRFRKDVIRLFGGDMFVPNPVVDQIREYLRESETSAPSVHAP